MCILEQAERHRHGAARARTHKQVKPGKFKSNMTEYPIQSYTDQVRKSIALSPAPPPPNHTQPHPTTPYPLAITPSLPVSPSRNSLPTILPPSLIRCLPPSVLPPIPPSLSPSPLPPPSLSASLSPSPLSPSLPFSLSRAPSLHTTHTLADPAPSPPCPRRCSSRMCSRRGRGGGGREGGCQPKRLQPRRRRGPFCRFLRQQRRRPRQCLCWRLSGPDRRRCSLGGGREQQARAMAVHARAGCRAARSNATLRAELAL